MQSTRKRLRAILAGSGPIVAPGVYDCLSALVAQQAGFKVLMVTGSGVAASALGVPDIGVMTMVDVLNVTRSIAQCVDVPVIADCDTGYGNPMNVMRTVREFENAGVACLFIEDQVAPWRCGHFEGKQVISSHDMVKKIEAALEARIDADLMIMARTDTLVTHGFDEAVSRARAYVAAGAEMLLISAPRSREEIAAIGSALKSLDVPLLINMTEGVRTPLLSAAELGEMGYKVISFAGSLQRVALKAMQDLAQSLHATGSVDGFYPERMDGIESRSRVLNLDRYYELEKRFASDGDIVHV